MDDDFFDPLGVLGGPPPAKAALPAALAVAAAPAPAPASAPVAPAAATAAPVLAAAVLAADPLSSAAAAPAVLAAPAPAAQQRSTLAALDDAADDPLGAFSSAAFRPSALTAAAKASAAGAVGGAGAAPRSLAVGPSAMTVTVVSDPLDASAALLPGGGGAAGGAGLGSSVSIGPLSAVSGYGISNAAAGAAAATAAKSPYLDWPVRRAAILREFSVSGTLHLSASFLASEDGGAGAAVDETAGEEVSVPLAKARQRLEALEAAARGAHTVEMSQAEYLRRIERLHRALQNAWDSNHRVAALKIAIQCAKLLGEHRVPRFYPSMFALVTEILDTFGRLVFERLKAIADEEHKRLGGKGPLPDAFIAADVGAEARETCRNWMYKTACIRELLPRLYIEMALLECYRCVN